jgi:CRISPR/Cas system CMR subunit Cmr6 (Cas7 group RAMP superfamily)
LFNWAEPAGPSSPPKSASPVPATVLIVPSAATFRTRWLYWSQMWTQPALSTATATGWFSCAASAAPPSPPKSASPVPANVLIVPSAATFRTRWFSASAM